MGKGKISSTLLACIAVGLVAIVAIAAVAIHGMNSNDTVSGSSGTSSTVDTADTSSLPSDTTSSEDAPVSSDTPSSSEAESSSQVSSSTKSETSSSTTSSGKRPAQYPPNDGDKVAYLTFDDGPSTKVTTRILETLDQYNVKATFFVVGTSNMNLLDDIHNAGHAIGLHSNTHEWDIYKSTDAYFADLQAISDKVYEKIGVRSKIIRFPGGSSNTISRNRCKGIMSTLVEEVEDRGYAYFDWNVDSTDASANKVDKDVIVDNVLRYSKNKTKICVLMHDLGIKTTTADALPEIIEGLQEMGFRFEVLTTESPVFHQAVNN